MNKKELKDFLDLKVLQYNTTDFIASDPIQIPYLFSNKEDIEIAAFFSATIAWGNRPMIIKNGTQLMHLMDDAPFDFVMNYTKNDLKVFDTFVHRTFNALDVKTFVAALQNIYLNHMGLEVVFAKNQEVKSMQKSIHEFKKIFFEIAHHQRTQKHVSDPMNNSAAKRINMFLRWMVRNDNKVDFGIWKTIDASKLSCPLDVHSGNVARKLGLLSRKQNDGKALVELDVALRKLDKNDPVKYDFALFGLGAFEGF